MVATEMSEKLPDFPPVPKWRPAFQQPLDEVIERVRYYTDGKRDFAVFKNGTCAVLDGGLSDEQAKTAALGMLLKTFYAHPDMNPLQMDDGNILVKYNQPLCNVVLAAFARAHWAQIEAHYLEGLARAEVLITPLGQNKFDDVGKQALFGRCFMFMDAQTPEVVQIARTAASVAR